MNAGEICNREVVVAYRNMTIDDLLDIVAEQLSDVVHAIERERVRETRIRR